MSSTPTVETQRITIGITGSRSLTDTDTVYDALERALKRAFATPPGTFKVLHGAASGVDSIAVDFFVRFPHDITAIRPDYNAHGHAAPFVRNQEIVDGSDCLIAIWDGQSKGTRHTIACAARKGIPVYVEVVSS